MLLQGTHPSHIGDLGLIVFWDSIRFLQFNAPFHGFDQTLATSIEPNALETKNPGHDNPPRMKLSCFKLRYNTWQACKSRDWPIESERGTGARLGRRGARRFTLSRVFELFRRVHEPMATGHFGSKPTTGYTFSVVWRDRFLAVGRARCAAQDLLCRRQVAPVTSTQ